MLHNQKLIECFDDYNMISSDSYEINKHNYLRYRIGRLKHEFWLKTRKSKDKIYIDEYDQFIIKNIQSGNTCFFGSAGYYLDDAIQNLTVIEQHPIVKAFFPKAIIVKDRNEIGKLYPSYFDNFVVVNNRADLWATLYYNDLGIPCLQTYFKNYMQAMKIGCKFFYSFRDTQIPNWNRFSQDHYDYFYNFALDCKELGLELLWHDIQFASKQKDNNGDYDILENPDTTNGNIKLLFEYVGTK